LAVASTRFVQQRRGINLRSHLRVKPIHSPAIALSDTVFASPVRRARNGTYPVRVGRHYFLRVTREHVFRRTLCSRGRTRRHTIARLRHDLTGELGRGDSEPSGGLGWEGNLHRILGLAVIALTLGSAGTDSAAARSVYIHGYTRSNGSHVHGYTRSTSGGRSARSHSISSWSPGSDVGSDRRRSTAATATPEHHVMVHRSAAARDEFKREHRCPSTGRPRGACPNYVIDHIKPLAVGGADTPSNMQWQTIKAAKAKDKIECYGHPCSRH
jgi:5-methylcytosine-specific restriction endonuclease McrA